MVKITDAAGQALTYGYNERGQTLTGHNAEGVLLFSNTYNDQHRITAQHDGISSHQPARFVYTEAPNSRRIRTAQVTTRLNKTRRYTFNDDFQVTEIQDELGNTTQYPYTEDGKVSSVTDGNGNTTH